jgi:hypothetical protein
VEALLAFFKAELEYLDANATDAIDVSNVPQVFRKGASHKVAIETLVKEKRDLIVRLLDQSGNEVGSWREDVKKGLHNQDFTVEVPDTVAPETKGQLVVSLVPNRGDRETVLVSQKTDIRFGKTEQILNSNAYWVSYTGQPSISLYASYYCPENCQIQADILSADGKILATKTIPTESPVVPDGAQYTSFELEVQAELFKQGQTYMFRVQLQNVNDAQEILASYSGSFLAGS